MKAGRQADNPRTTAVGASLSKGSTVKKGTGEGEGALIGPQGLRPLGGRKECQTLTDSASLIVCVFLKCTPSFGFGLNKVWLPNLSDDCALYIQTEVSKLDHPMMMRKENVVHFNR